MLVLKIIKAYIVSGLGDVDTLQMLLDKGASIDIVANNSSGK